MTYQSHGFQQFSKDALGSFFQRQQDAARQTSGLDDDTEELITRLLQQQAGTIGRKREASTADGVVPAFVPHGTKSRSQSTFPLSGHLASLNPGSPGLSGVSEGLSTSSGGLLTQSWQQQALGMYRSSGGAYNAGAQAQGSAGAQLRGHFGGGDFQVPASLPRGSDHQRLLSAPLAPPPQMVPNCSSLTAQPVGLLGTARAGMNPGALARKQRASEDSKRGKRRRALQESGAASVAEPLAADVKDASVAQPQVVPVQASSQVAPTNKLKEERRKKRLLRNRVSAQQARERKRQHTQEMELKCKAMEAVNRELEIRAEALAQENEELRQIVKNNMKGNGASSTVSAPANPVAGHLEALRQMAAANKAAAAAASASATSDDLGGAGSLFPL